MNESADDTLGRHVWRCAAQSEWRADPPGGALEVRVQEHQVDRQISLVEKQPLTSWSMSAPNEYGFYSNVNPEVHHPRWSQATERRIGEFSKRKTLMFNGYVDQVASMYAGMDLQKYY